MSHKGQCFCLAQSLTLFFQVTFKVSIFTEFQNHENVLSRSEIIVQHNDKRRRQRGKIFYLIFDLFFDSLGDLFDVDDFDCHFFAMSILAIINMPCCSSSKRVRFEEAIVANFLDDLLAHILYLTPY